MKSNDLSLHELEITNTSQLIDILKPVSNAFYIFSCCKKPNPYQ